MQEGEKQYYKSLSEQVKKWNKMPKENNQQYPYFRRLKPYQRIQLAFELHDLARSRVSGEIKRLYPNLTTQELLKVLNQRFIR